jgi:hypothetical protein
MTQAEPECVAHLVQVGRHVIKNKKRASSKKMHGCFNPNIA